MEAPSTEKTCKKKDVRPSTERVSLGRRFEDCAVLACEKRGYKILKRNLRFAIGEVDVLAADPKGKRYVLVEVRGRKGSAFRPSRTISFAKVRRLKLLARILQRQFSLPLHIELVEILLEGNKPQVTFFSVRN